MRKRKVTELERKTLDEFKQTSKCSIIIVLDNVRSLHNVGSIFRTADAFLVESIYLCGITGKPPHREIQKTALGATNSVDWKYFSNSLEAIGILKSAHYELIAVEQVHQSITLSNFIPSKDKKYALIFGNEVNGIDEEVMKLADFSIEIPQFGTKHSLNIAVSAGIVMWDIFSKIYRS